MLGVWGSRECQGSGGIRGLGLLGVKKMSGEMGV